MGNNALICRALDLIDPVGFGVHGDRTIGFLATADPPLSLSELLGRVRAEINPEPLVFDAGPEAIGRVAVVSGAAAQDVLPAADAGADCFLTGEPREPVMAQAREAGIHFVAAGHYATEVFGVRAAGRSSGPQIRRRAHLHRRPEPDLAVCKRSPGRIVDAIRTPGYRVRMDSRSERA